MDIFINLFTIWLQTFGLSLLQPPLGNTLFCRIRWEENLASGKLYSWKKTSWTPCPRGSYTGLLEAGYSCQPTDLGVGPPNVGGVDSHSLSCPGESERQAQHSPA